jgi:glucose/arabinose dehydrogenase
MALLALPIAVLALLAPAGAPPPAPSAASAGVVPTDFQETTVFTGLTNPTVVRFASDGRVFVAEKSGLIKVFDNLADTTPTTFADLRTNVYNFWDRGLLGLALAPNFPTTPYVYVLYTYDHELGSPNPAPRWGTPGVTSDPCPTPPGATSDGCVVSARLSRLQASGNTMTGPEQVLIEDWCQQYPSHSIGTVEFGPDGALYASAGDGAAFHFDDYGQDGNPLNPCGDPPGGVGAVLTSPTAEGGALRSQDLRTSGDPATLDGSLIRVDPATGAAMSGNPQIGSSDPNVRRIIAYGMRNPFRFTFRPGTSEIWLGDVGLADYEEINRIPSPTDSVVENFGWPCYEGAQRQAAWDSANVNICENLYNQPSADTKPFFAYHHSSKVVPNEACPSGGSSIAGLSFEFSPTASTYPASYQRGLFFADYSRKCIWVMKKDANGIPAPGLLETFVSAAAGPVNLEFGPGGDLFYVDFDGGTIRRISYTGSGGSDPPPTCPSGQYGTQYFSNTTLSGTAAIARCENAPLNYNWGTGGPGSGVPIDNFSARWTGQFAFAGGATTFTATADDGIRVWVDGTILIDQWIDQPPTTYTATRTLTAGSHQVKVEYYEKDGGAVAQLSWTSAPTGCSSGQYAADYYSNLTLSGTPVLTRCENAPLNYNWGTGGPGSGVPIDNFSARWGGTFAFAGGATTFTATADDGIRVWVDGTILIDQWIDQPATTYTASRTLSAGNHDVKVEYYEKAGNAVAQVSWAAGTANAPPVPSITAPPSTTTWKVGDLIAFNGSASDPEDGTLPASALTWTLLLQHCPSNCHTHTVQSWNGVASGSFNAPDHEYPSYIDLRLTATDSAGASASTTLRLDPKTVTLTFQSVPTGLQLAVGGSASTAPFTRTVIQGSTNSLSATTPQTVGGTTYQFASWSDGGAQTHNIVAPQTAATYTATFATAAATPPTNTALPSISGNTRVIGKLLTVSNGTWTGSTPLTFTYRWLRCDSGGGSCVDIPNATGQKYATTSSDAGSRLRATVTAANAGGTASATSNPTDVIRR